MKTVNKNNILSLFEDRVKQQFTSFIVNHYNRSNPSSMLNMRDRFREHINEQLAGEIEYIQTFLPEHETSLIISEIYSEQLSQHISNMIN